MILLSLHPGPPSETSAFRRMRAFSSRLAGPLPLRTSACSCSRSCALNRTTYFFTAMSFPAMIPSAARIAARANHLILSNWLKPATRDGGLLSYGPDTGDMFRRAAPYIDCILRGAKPAELPVQLPTKFQMAVNLKTAKSLGLAIPESFLVRADEVIE